MVRAVSAGQSQIHVGLFLSRLLRFFVHNTVGIYRCHQKSSSNKIGIFLRMLLPKICCIPSFPFPSRLPPWKQKKSSVEPSSPDISIRYPSPQGSCLGRATKIISYFPSQASKSIRWNTGVGFGPALGGDGTPCFIMRWSYRKWDILSRSNQHIPIYPIYMTNMRCLFENGYSVAMIHRYPECVVLWWALLWCQFGADRQTKTELSSC